MTRTRKISSLFQTLSGVLGQEVSSQTVAGSALKRILYDTHQPISPLQRLGLTFISALRALDDPSRADMVATLAETTGTAAVRRLHAAMLADRDGRKILEEKPIISSDSIDLEWLRSLPSNTFGSAYASFLGQHSFNPDDRMPVKFMDDAELAYVMLRYRQVHDLWHVLSGLPPTLEGEVALKWFEMVHTGLPMTTLSALGGSLQLSKRKEILLKHYIPWALRAGRSTVPLLNVWYEKNWETDLESFRHELQFLKVPPILQRMSRK